MEVCWKLTIMYACWNWMHMRVVWNGICIWKDELGRTWLDRALEAGCSLIQYTHIRDQKFEHVAQQGLHYYANGWGCFHRKPGLMLDPTVHEARRASMLVPKAWLQKSSLLPPWVKFGTWASTTMESSCCIEVLRTARALPIILPRVSGRDLMVPRIWGSLLFFIQETSLSTVGLLT
jgi:hypothetical protein